MDVRFFSLFSSFVYGYMLFQRGLLMEVPYAVINVPISNLDILYSHFQHFMKGFHCSISLMKQEKLFRMFSKVILSILLSEIITV